MSIPIIFAAGAGLALLFAGSKDGKVGASSGDGSGASAGGGESVGASQASTAGDQGGAQYPSHTDGSATQGMATFTQEPEKPAANTAVADAVSGFTLATAPAPADTWSGPAKTAPASPTGFLGYTAGSTVKATGQLFESVGSAFGAIW